jgi:hypothetical protein
LQVVRGRFPADDAPAYRHKEGEDFAVERVIVPLALGQNPCGLARAPVADAYFRIQLLGIFGGGVTGE